MEPATKKRKLAPKVTTSVESRPQISQHHHDPPPHYPVPEPLLEHHAFESFARHLQDAAMLIQRQTERPPYREVSVLLLKWDDDNSSDEETTVLESVLRNTYHYHTQRWEIPSCPNPSIKLGVQIASFLENPRPDHLLIIHYAGHGFVGQDGQFYWASSERDDSSKLKWDGVRCLFEDAQSDMLLLLDTSAIPNSGTSGSHGVKQAISANMNKQEARQTKLLSLTAAAGESLRNLSNAQSFTARQLYDEIRVLVCTTFVGDASPDMSSFHKWLQTPPLMGEKISVEGMFLGPPLMLLISMPHAVWNIVQHDKVCCFLGYISTHNMLHLYGKLIGPTSHLESSAHASENWHPHYEARKSAVEALARTTEHERCPSKEQPLLQMGRSAGLASLKPKEEHEGTAEMREAAEQLKALSHVGHLSDESTPTSARPRTSLPNGSAQSDQSFREGDESTFGSKNEWKRHITSQHLCLQYYRCSACPNSSVEGKGSEFNRKDLFTQHLRRMHAPFQVKRPPSKVDNKIEIDWEVRVKQMQESCLVQRRHPPQKGACPKLGCSNMFEGHTAWDEWTEHVGRHMEKGEAGGIGVDQNLIDWALQEKIIASKGEGEYRLCYHGASAANGASNENSSPVAAVKKDEKTGYKDKDSEKNMEKETESLSASTTTSMALSQPAPTAGTSQTELDASPRGVKANSPTDGDEMIANGFAPRARLRGRRCVSRAFTTSSARWSTAYDSTIPNLRIGKDTKVIFQGFTGKAATANAKDTIAYGTSIVGGVSPGKGGQTHLDRPVFDSVREAVLAVNPDVSAVFVPAAFAAAAIIESIEAEMPLVVSVAEHIPVHDMLRVQEVLRTQTKTRRGCVGIVSKSGTLSYEAVGATTKIGLGQSLVMGMGGDMLPGTTLVDGLRTFFDHEETKGIIVIGEIGGDAELKAAALIREYRRSTANPKPIIAMVAGRMAPPGKIMGHAGAILQATEVSAEDKARALADAGAVVVPHPGVMGVKMEQLLRAQ
ncbi:uncharacterized protein J7T54_000824 [Emericellopsis cladophorae]|uniref:CoA-binding domain-containing protein n=1 Tax=Emericellopsis cladophorae TaxID=2686198 RepID=A0A9P9Y393_9HYPO|nr:uncharacterized protein J7T54_000824 [Emericellopsis cladophorae]KAI6782681.1 hypothetical protein J7T54_000824 [Emericellopsis cladophorae]